MQKWFTWVAACLLTISPMTVRGNESALAAQEERVAIETRPLSQEQVEVLAKEEADQQTAAMKNSGGKRSKDSQLIESSYAPLSYFYERDGNLAITRPDGSVWRICPSDKETVLKWNVEDLTAVTPYSCFFSSNYKFEILNISNNESVRANIVMGPFSWGNLIARIDRKNNRIFLSDLTIWEVSNSKALETWEAFDSIVIGVNNSLLARLFGRSNVLINISNLSHSKAKRTFNWFE